MARLFNIPAYSTVEVVNIAAVRTGEMLAQYKMAAGLTAVENGQLLAFDHQTKTVSLPTSSEDFVVLAASEERLYAERGLTNFKTSGKNLPRLLFLRAGDKFETNAVEAGDFTSIEEASDPKFGAKYGIPSTSGDIELVRALPGDATYKTILEVVEFITLPSGAPGVRFAVVKSGVIGVEVDESDEANFLAFSFPQQNKPAVISATNKTVDIEVKYGTAVTALVADFVLSPFATAKISSTAQVSGTTANNFTSAKTYTITSEDGTSVNWTVTVTVANPNLEANFLTFALEDDQTGPATINTTNKTIALEVLWDTDVTALVPKFTVSPGATVKVGSTAQVSGVTINNFTSAVTYSVTPESGVAVDWTVTISVEA